MANKYAWIDFWRVDTEQKGQVEPEPHIESAFVMRVDLIMYAICCDMVRMWDAFTAKPMDAYAGNGFHVATIFLLLRPC